MGDLFLSHWQKQKHAGFILHDRSNTKLPPLHFAPFALYHHKRALTQYPWMPTLIAKFCNGWKLKDGTQQELTSEDWIPVMYSSPSLNTPPERIAIWIFICKNPTSPFAGCMAAFQTPFNAVPLDCNFLDRNFNMKSLKMLMENVRFY